MSEEQLKAFLEIVKLDGGLQAKIKEVRNVQQFVALAKELGYSFSKDDLKILIEDELTDDDLHEVRGGGQGAIVNHYNAYIMDLKNKFC